MHHDLPVRQMAAELFSQGVGDKGVASALGLPEKTAERWLYTYRALGKEALFVTTHKKYSHELKVAAARDVVENGMTRPDAMAKYGIASLSPLSIPSAKAGRLSVIRLIHRMCAGSSSVKPSMVAMKMPTTSLRLELSRN